MSFEKEKDVLIALLKEKDDQYYADVEHWYRIPTSTKQVPLMVRNKSIKYIAFWFPKIYENDKWSVQYYAEVKNISIVKGKDIKYQTGHPKANKEYYKIEFDRVEELPNPIYSKRGRRILFITTTQEHLKTAQELNDLFYESPLEEKLWKEFKKEKIYAERQLLLQFKKSKKKYILDFALYCKSRNIAIECDGDTYHMGTENIEHDKERDNILYLNNWDTMRFTSKKINYELDETVGKVCEAIQKYGGMQDPEDLNKFRYLSKDKATQTRLFED